MSTGYLVHTFDLLNVGDLDLIVQARQRCTHLVLGVLTDELVEQLYGRPPLVPLDDRLALVARVRGVDEVRPHAAGTGLPDRATVFVAAAEPRPPQLAAAVPLPRRRETSSAVVRAALAARAPLVGSTGASPGAGGAG